MGMVALSRLPDMADKAKLSFHPCLRFFACGETELSSLPGHSCPREGAG
jgi:hypothetical protein